MAFLDELMGATAAPGAGPDLKQFLGPIMEAMATESRRAADPISRIGDVGSAVLGTVGSGIPYGQGLAALDKQRSDTIKGSAQLFLSMLGQERQLEQLKAEDRRHQERISIDRERLGETKRQHDTSTALALRGQDLTVARQAAAQKEAEAVRQEQDHDTTRKTLSGATNDPIKYASVLDGNPEYIAARKARDWEKANKIAAAAAEAVGKKTDLPADLRIRDVAYQNVGDAATELNTLLKTGPSVIDPTDRARIRQLWSKMVLQYGIATGRGANYTELEKQLVTDILGQSPTDLRYRSIESIAQFQKRLGIFQEGMGRELQNLRGAGQRKEPATSPTWRGEPEAAPAPRNSPIGAPRESAPAIQPPPGWKFTGRYNADGRPIFTDGTREAVPPRK